VGQTHPVETYRASSGPKIPRDKGKILQDAWPGVCTSIFAKLSTASRVCNIEATEVPAVETSASIDS
jgi:hypothetical protein